MSHAERMQKIASLIDSPDKWNKGSFARNANGDIVHYYAEDACSFCLMGAFWKTYREHQIHNDAVYAGLNILRNAVRSYCVKLPQSYGYDISVTNDHPDVTHTDIKNIVAEAIKLGSLEDAKKKEPISEEQSEY
jgi:hypothetical protein